MRKFIELLEREGELQRIADAVDPVLEIAAITDRVTKAGGPALLFENTGTDFAVATNLFGTRRRLELALGNLDDVQGRIKGLFEKLMSQGGGKLSKLPVLGSVARWMPRKRWGRGACQRVRVGSLDELPVLKLWPKDGGRFVTLPLVHTIDPVTGARNVGMYRMQIFDGLTTGMHWQVHKTGERHYREWSKKINNHTSRRNVIGAETRGSKSDYPPVMPVTVCLGGDPVYSYCATAPLPDGVDEYLLAGFLRGRPVRLVRCLTNDLWVPEDCDFVIEGYVDTAEDKFPEGPFGDHTGFYSPVDLYPKFHVTAITRRRDAVYPATVVGIPPQEDFHLAVASEKIFLEPLRMVYPEIVDLHMPAAGTAHNLAIVSIDKAYSGQAFKVASALWGTGQMMFNKVLVVVPREVSVRDYETIIERLKHIDPRRDIFMGRGVADALDHAAVDGEIGKIAFDLTTEPSSEEVRYEILADADCGELWQILANVDPARDISIAASSPFSPDCSAPFITIDGRRKDGYPEVARSTPETEKKVDLYIFQ